MDRRKFIGAMLTAPVAFVTASADPQWWMPGDRKRWLRGPGRLPHPYDGHPFATEADYWRASCIAHGFGDPLLPPWERT